MFEAVLAVSSGRPALVIAHRLAAVRNADRIYRADEGRILESGRPGELVRYDSRYRQLYEAPLAAREITASYAE